MAVRVLNELPTDTFEEKARTKGKKDKKNKDGSKVAKGASSDVVSINAEAIEGARVIKWSP